MLSSWTATSKRMLGTTAAAPAATSHLRRQLEQQQQQQQQQRHRVKLDLASQFCITIPESDKRRRRERRRLSLLTPKCCTSSRWWWRRWPRAGPWSRSSIECEQPQRNPSASDPDEESHKERDGRDENPKESKGTLSLSLSKKKRTN